MAIEGSVIESNARRQNVEAIDVFPVPAFIPAALRLKNRARDRIPANVDEHVREIAIVRQMPPVRANTMHHIGQDILATPHIAAILRILAIRRERYRIDCRGPGIKASILGAVIGLIAIAPAFALETRSLRAIRVIQVLGHPPLVSKLHGLVGLSVTFIGQGTVFAVIFRFCFAGDSQRFKA